MAALHLAEQYAQHPAPEGTLLVPLDGLLLGQMTAQCLFDDIAEVEAHICLQYPV